MKYTIEGFNQEQAIKENLDVVDLVILRWIVDFEPNMAKKEIDGETYFWINYQSLLNALPILDIKKLALYRRLGKMCDVEILKHKNVKDNGNYSYYTFGEKYKILVSSKIEPSIVEDRTLISSKIEQNNSSIKEIHLLNNNLIPIVPLEKGNTCKYHISKNKVCRREAKLKINETDLCGQHAKMYLTKIGKTELLVDLEQLMKKQSNKFVKPTLEEVKNYCQERENKIDAENFIDYYESNGWKVGRNPMRDWKACIRTWEKNKKQQNKSYSYHKSNYELSQEALAKARKELEDGEKASNGYT